MIPDSYLKLIRAIAKAETIPADDNGPRPTKTFITADLLALTPSSLHRGEVDDNGERRNAAHRSGTLQLQAYGKDCWEVLELLSMEMFHDANLDMALEEFGIAWGGQPRLEMVPALVDNVTYEPRAILEVATSYTTHNVEVVGLIETVEGAANFTQGRFPGVWTDFTATVVVPDEP